MKLTRRTFGKSIVAGITGAKVSEDDSENCDSKMDYQELPELSERLESLKEQYARIETTAVYQRRDSRNKGVIVFANPVVHNELLTDIGAKRLAIADILHYENEDKVMIEVVSDHT